MQVTNQLEPNRPEYLTVDEAAEYIRTPVATLYAWRHRNQGPPAHKVGKRLLYRRDDLIAWVEGTRAS